MDPATLAAAARAAVTPYLMSLSKDVAEEGVKATGKSVFDWIKGKLTGAAGKEAIADLEKAPDAPENQQALRAALVKALKADPQAAEALRALLPAAVSGGQTVNQTGSHNIGVAAERGSSVSINR